MTRHQALTNYRTTACAICGQPLSFHQQWAGDICSDWRCRWTQLNRELEAHRQEAAFAIGVKHPETYGALVVPHRNGTIKRLPSERRAAHLNLLNQFVKEIKPCDEEHDIEQGESLAEEPPVTIAKAVCAVCGGACCHHGGDQAFLDTSAIERFIAVNHITELSNIVSAYATHLPEQSIAGSCVYHTFDGCALPRSMRANICNEYRCSGLKQAEHWVCNDRVIRVYVVVRKDNIIKRSAFVQSGTIRHYPLPDSRAYSSSYRG